MSPRVVLVGLPGAGKSAVGRRLAKILVVPFADSDELVEAAAGRSVPEIFEIDGEPAFRAAEAAAVATALVEFSGILSLGGGAVGSTDIRRALRESPVPVVLLRARLDTLVARVGAAESRPLLSEDPAARLAALAAERAPWYDEVATFAVDTDDRSAGQVAATVAARLHDLEVAR